MTLTRTQEVPTAAPAPYRALSGTGSYRGTAHRGRRSHARARAPHRCLGRANRAG